MTSPYVLYRGTHAPEEGRRCAAEWVAWLAGESHSDRPACLSPLLREFVVWLNDDLPHRTRQKLRPYLSRMVGTSGDGFDDARLAALYEYGTGTPAGSWFARPVQAPQSSTSKRGQVLLPDPHYYARMAASVAATRREVPVALMEDMLPTIQLGDVEVKPAARTLVRA